MTKWKLELNLLGRRFKIMKLLTKEIYRERDYFTVGLTDDRHEIERGVLQVSDYRSEEIIDTNF